MLCSKSDHLVSYVVNRDVGRELRSVVFVFVVVLDWLLVSVTPCLEWLRGEEGQWQIDLKEDMSRMLLWRYLMFITSRVVYS
eukprot:gene8197-5723_t